MKRVSSIVVIGLLCVSMFLVYPPKIKAETNSSSFETGFEGWEPFTQAGGSLVQLSTTHAHSGMHSVEQIGRSSGSEPTSSVGGIRFPVSSTLDQYELSAWVYVTERSDANAASLFGFAYGNEFVAWNPWGSSSSYVYVRLSEGYQTKGDWYNPVPYGLTPNTWHQVNVKVYTNLGTVSIWLDGSSIVEQWPAFNAGETPTYYDIECSANYYGTYVMHQFVDDVQISESPGPVGYWKFDEGSGTVAHDSSGNGNDGIIHTATWTAGIVGSSLHFNGVDSWVQIPSSPTLTGLSQITLEAWIQEDSITTELKGIISKCDGWFPPTNAEYFLGTNDNGRVLFDIDNGVSIAGSNPPTHFITEAGRWYHIAGTWSGNSYAIYVNGVQVFSGTCTPQTTLSNTLPVQIGRHGDWPWVYFQGIIDEVKIYNYARTAEEIQSDTRVLRAWKDDSSLGLENDRLYLHGLAATGNYKWFFDYLVFKDTGTTWYQPWGELALIVFPNFQWKAVSTTDFEVNAFTEADKAYLKYSITSGNLKEELRYTIYPGEPYVYLTLSVMNVGSATENTYAGVQFTTWIAGDHANDYFYVPGHGQGQFSGVGNVNFPDATETWIAEWDQNKGEGCGMLSAKSFTPSNMITEDFGIGEGFKFISDNFDLAPGQTSATYDCYLYFFTGTGWQKAKDFYDSVVRKPDFEIGASPDSTTADPHLPTSFEITVKSLNGFNQPVTLRAVYSSHELSGNFEDTVVTPPAGGSETTTLTVSVLSEEMVTHQIYITGTSGMLSHSKTVSLQVPFLSVPYFHQGDTQWCVCASVAMIMDFFGKSVHPWDVAASLDLTHDQSFNWLLGIVKLKEYLAAAGLYSEPIDTITKDKLTSLLQEGEPIVFGAAKTLVRPIHVVVVTGYLQSDDSFFINDPGGILIKETLGDISPPYIQCKVSWSLLSPYVQDPFSWALGINGSPQPKTGALNLIGGRPNEINGESSFCFSHGGGTWVDNVYVWEQGKAEDGTTTGLTWKNQKHGCWLDPEDYLSILNPFYSWVPNPTDTSQVYDFELDFLKEGSLIKQIPLDVLPVQGCSWKNPTYTTAGVYTILGENYGTYTIRAKLLSKTGVLIDQIDLPPIEYKEKALTATVHSPANLFLTDPSGRSEGTNPNTGQFVDEIPDAFYSGSGTEPQVVMIPDPIDGTYNIMLVGTATGSYTLTIEYINASQTVTQSFDGTIAPKETRYYSDVISSTGKMTPISWDYVFKDAKRDTMLKISTDDKYFQFTAPGKDFEVKNDPKMTFCRNTIAICYNDKETCMGAIATTGKTITCTAIVLDKQTHKLYSLISYPNCR